MYYIGYHGYDIEPINIYQIDNGYCDRLSFYGKAKIVETADELYLQSYNTLVCVYNKELKSFTRLWKGYSTTTMRHINAFVRHYCKLPGGGKAWWDKLQVGRVYLNSEMQTMQI